MEVTVGDVTVIITDYKLLPVKDEPSPPPSPKDAKHDEAFENENSNTPCEIEKKEDNESHEEQEAISS